MALEINPPLDPGKVPHIKVGQKKNAAPARLAGVFTGAPTRVAAFTLDALLFYVATMLLDKTARPALLNLNPWLPWFGLPLVFLYFCVMQGPLGKGATFGKSIMGIRVVGPDGLAPGWRPAATRALLQTAVFSAWTGILVAILSLVMGRALAAGYVDDMTYALGMPPASWRAFIFISALLGRVAFVLGIAELLSIIVHPRRRAWHDLLAGTHVTAADPAAVAAGAAEPLTPSDISSLKHARMTVPIVALICSALYMGTLAKQLLDAETQQKIGEFIANQELAPPGFSLGATLYPTDTLMMMEKTRLANQDRPDKLPDTSITTETLRRSFGIDEMTIVADVIRKHGTLGPELENPEFQTAIGRLRAHAWAESEKLRAARRAKDGAVVPVAGTFLLHAGEPLQFLGYERTVYNWGVRGPANPVRGPLVFKSDPNPLYHPADAATSATLAQ